MWQRVLKIISGALVGVVAITVVSLAFMYYPFIKLENTIESLNSEQQVVEMLGEPNHQFFKGESDYYFKGFSYEERVINHKVAVYITDFNGILYVYYDQNSLIEHYYLGDT